MIDMPRPRPPYLHRETSRHGKVVWYVRLAGKRTRLRAAYGSPEFAAEYRASIDGAEIAAKPKTDSASLAWLIARYRDSSAWTALSMATRRQRENIFKQVIARDGDQPFAAVTRKALIAARERRKETPAQANNLVKALRGLFKWAHESEMLDSDPAREVEALKVRTKGFHAWTEEEVARFEARWPTGTRERLAFDLLLYTGLRRGDAVRLGRQHVRNGVFQIKTEKTGTEIVAPLLPVLAASIAASPTGDLAFIAGERGKPMTKESFGNWFRLACASAGVPGSAHGLRKAGATRAANNGATVAQLGAIFGWTGAKMPSLYTQSADRARLARDAMSKLSGTASEQPIVAPKSKVRARRPESK
jgi:integrase